MSSIHHIMGARGEARARAHRMENLLEKRTESFPCLVKETHIQVQEAQRSPNKMTPEGPTSRHTHH